MDDFAEFFAATRHGVFRAVYTATGNRSDAEDVVAEAYARACRQWDAVARHPNPTAWVVRTALNVHRSWWRRVRREVVWRSSQGQAEAIRLAGSVHTVESLLDTDVRAAVRALPRRQREVVALRLLSDFSAEQTGELLGLAPATVHVHLHRALATLRRRLHPDSPDGPMPMVLDGGGANADPLGGGPAEVLELSMRWVVRCAL